ncbi:MAG TPA: hypothetical protein VN612_10495 [Acidobacteriaceae bacterium]|nr:hypothetical protein [Acidobacteriaceae bacterium]
MTGIGEQSEEIVDAIVKDLRNRSGLGDEWDALLFSDSVAIEDEWRLIVRRILERG